MNKVIIYTDGSCKHNGLWFACGGWAAILQAFKDKDEWECTKCGYKGKLETYEDTEGDGDVWGTCPECDVNCMVLQTTDPSVPVATSKFSGMLTHNTDKIPVTNIRAEMYGILESLRKIVKKCEVELNSDNETCIKCLNEQSAKKSNTDLWERIDREIGRLKLLGCKLRFVWVKAHNGNLHNEAMDKMAKKRMTQAEPVAVGVCRACKDKRETCGFPPENENNCDGLDPRSSVEKEFPVCMECLNDRMICGFEPTSKKHCDGEGTVIGWEDIDEKV